MSSNRSFHYDIQYPNPIDYKDISLKQIGTAFLQSGAVIDTHSHIDFFELTIITKGKGKITTNNFSLPVKAGDIYVSFPYDLHKIESDRIEEMHYNYLAFFIKKEDMLSESKKICEEYAHPAERIIHDDTLNSLLGSAISETRNKKVFNKEYLEAIFTQILIRIIRDFSNQTVEKTHPQKREEICYQVMDYINSHLYSIESLTDISNYFNYNYSYLSKIFTAVTSQSISEYFRFQRLETARDLILKGELSITQIAELLNYSSIYAFSKSFKAKYSISPRDYRKKQAL